MPIDFKNAAHRHHDSAELLYQQKFWGDADHLYGFSAECVLKALMIALGAPTKSDDLKKDRHRKHINVLWNEYSSFVSGCSQSHYVLPDGDPFNDWDIAQRYFGSGNFNQNIIDPHRQATQNLLRKLQQANTELNL